MKRVILVILLLIVLPIAISAARYFTADGAVVWSRADRSSAGLLPEAAKHDDALVRVFSARTVRWRGIFAVHTWIVVKEKGAQRYMRFDYTAWGEPIRINGFVPDGRWFGDIPQVIGGADGEAAAAMVPKIVAAVQSYQHRSYGDYRAFPGPNSNTFVAAVLTSVPELKISLPPTAIGKDYPWTGDFLSPTVSGTGWRISLWGYAGLTIGWVEGFELNVMGAVIGLDIRRPALKLPGLGRLGMA